MDKNTAKRVNELLLEASGCLDESVALILQNCTDAEIDRFRDSISKAMEALLFEVLKPIYFEHPDLEPDQIKAHRP